LTYKNAKEFLPEHLLAELQKYAGGQVIYVPVGRNNRTEWGAKNGSKSMYAQRNERIKHLKERGFSISEIADAYYLSPESIRKIVK
jgi:Mor family transcriptional regulator